MHDRHTLQRHEWRKVPVLVGLLLDQSFGLLFDQSFNQVAVNINCQGLLKYRWQGHLAMADSP